MSGIELAGLVLGAFPVLMHALDSYREGAETLKDWWQIQRAYKRCKHDLDYHRTIFEGNVERLLLPIVEDEDQLKDLVENPASEGWREVELEVRLHQRLPMSYNIFLDIMDQICSIMESLKTELGVDGPLFFTKSTQANSSLLEKQRFSKSSIEHQAKRIKFTFKKSSREKLFNKFETANDRLRKLLESNDQLAEARRNRDTTKLGATVNKRIDKFWQHALKLHDALSRTWQCGCGSHGTSLQLQHKLGDIHFDVLFEVGHLDRDRGWRETKIKMLTDKNDIVSQDSPVQQHLSPISSSTQPAQGSEIQCLCSTLSQSCSGCFGILDENGSRFGVYPGDNTTLNPDMNVVTLEKLFTEPPGALTRRRRYWLALTLATSYLQFHSTPWLHKPLEKSSILFFRNPTNTNTLSRDAAYIRGDMPNSNSVSATDTMSILGIRLLELCFGTTIEKNVFRRSLPPGDTVSAPFLDRAAAFQWSKMVNEEAGPEFAGAVDWCLRANEPASNSWRKDIWTHVVVPLDYCHKQVSQRFTIY